MRPRHYQRGLSFWGFVFVALIGVIALLLAVKLVPVYMEYYSVVNAVNGVANEPGVERESPREVYQMLQRRLYTSYVDEEHVGDENIKISRGKDARIIIDYERRVPLIANLDLIATFHTEAVLGD